MTPVMSLILIHLIMYVPLRVGTGNNNRRCGGPTAVMMRWLTIFLIAVRTDLEQLLSLIPNIP